MPAQGKSATCLSYRLWIRRDLEPHNGHSAIPASDRTAKIIESDESLTLSINVASIRSILKNGLDRAFLDETSDHQPLHHGNIRGQGYFH